MAIAIDKWLKSEKDYNEGLKLFKLYNSSKALLCVFEMGATHFNKKKLLQELKAINKENPTIKEETPGAFEEQPTQKHQPKQNRHKIDYYPEGLHPAYKRQSYLYKLINNLQPQLEILEQEQAEKACMIIVESGDEIHAIYKLFDYWEENDVVLPNSYTENKNMYALGSLREMEKRKMNLRTYISKFRKDSTKVLKLEEWKQELALIEIELEKYG